MPKKGPIRATILVGFTVLTLLLVTAASARCAGEPATSQPEASIERCATEARIAMTDSETNVRLDPEIIAGLIAWIDAKTGGERMKPRPSASLPKRS